MILRALIVDGEIFVIKVFDAFGCPKIQIIESHRLMSPDRETNTNVVDGIEFDASGRVLNYYFLIGDKDETTKVPANAVLHIFDAERTSQARAYPQIQHSVNDVIDRKEILALEKKKVKAISDIVHVIKGGNMPTDGDYKVDVGSKNPDGTSPETMARILGGKNIKIEADESLDVHESNIPSPTFSGFISTLDRDGSLGVLPYEFSIDPTKIGGATTRLIASKTQRYIDDMTLIIDERFNDAIWFFAIGWAIDNGELEAEPWWWYCTWTHPRKLTVDAGREEQQNRANVEMGLKTLEESFSECGLDFEDEMRTRASNARFIMTLAGIPESEAIPLWMLYKVNGTQIIPSESEDKDKKKKDE
jgi:capsid protein